ncbi:MAG TPA: DUF2934 domain-containing protein [Verrucomicrobiae bacterium]|nr:DUF2934 domain-containing protein [Verrucomicrobiae bacterium]
MLNNPQVDQTRGKGDANFQRMGNGQGSTATTSASARRESEPASATRPRKTASTDTQSTAQAKPPTHEEIKARAFQIYVKKGRPEGRDTENWLEAEAELHRERGIKTAKR